MMVWTLPRTVMFGGTPFRHMWAMEPNEVTDFVGCTGVLSDHNKIFVVAVESLCLSNIFISLFRSLFQFQNILIR